VAPLATTQLWASPATKAVRNVRRIRLLHVQDLDDQVALVHQRGIGQTIFSIVASTRGAVSDASEPERRAENRGE